MDHVLLGRVAGVMAIVQVIPYIVSIFRGHTKPERMSYFIWVLLEGISAASYIAVGARTTIWPGVAYTLTAVLIFALSIKRGMGGFSKFDIVCLILALGGIGVWLGTNNALLTLYFSMFVGVIAYLPTIKKAYFFPETENTLSWVMTACTAMINLFALTTLAPSIALNPLLSVIEPTIVAYFLLFPVAHAKIARRKTKPKIHTFLGHPIFAR